MTVAERRYVCPVCRREAKPTMRGNIPSHFDQIRQDVCPATGHPFRIMIERQPEYVGVMW